MREWYVMRLGRPENATKGRIGGQRQEGAPIAPGAPLDFAIEANVGVGRPVRAQPRQNQRQADIEEEIARQIVPQQAVGYGYWPQLVREDFSGLIAFTTKPAAREFAKELAAKTPRVLYGVFECVEVFETTEPVVVSKRYNDSDELVVLTAENAGV